MRIGREIVEPLLAWYAAEARTLPWREHPTPYRVWISEIMLQQTRVEAVKPYFERFVAVLPDVRALAACPEAQLMKLWEGLGYYSRARNLQRAAQVLVRDFDGELPADYEALLKLPGIGPYTAGAVASIAFGLPAPAVDGNVLRVAARLCASEENTALPAVRSAVGDRLRAILPPGRAGDFNQALMELGATVCLPSGAPLCTRCPLRRFCAACNFGSPEAYPVKPEKRRRRTEQYTVFVLRTEEGVLLRRRPERGLLAGLWELPHADGHLDEKEAAQAIEKLTGCAPEELHPLPPRRHIFTHIEWEMTAYEGRVAPPDPALGLAPCADQAAVPTAFRKFL